MIRWIEGTANIIWHTRFSFDKGMSFSFLSLSHLNYLCDLYHHGQKPRLSPLGLGPEVSAHPSQSTQLDLGTKYQWLIIELIKSINPIWTSYSLAQVGTLSWSHVLHLRVQKQITHSSYLMIRQHLSQFVNTVTGPDRGWLAVNVGIHHSNIHVFFIDKLSFFLSLM